MTSEAGEQAAIGPAPQVAAGTGARAGTGTGAGTGAGKFLGRLLRGHPEARSLLAEASHCSALAGQSRAAADQAALALAAARLGHEELRHRLDPRGKRPVRWPAGLTLVAAIGAGLAGLDWIDLAGLPAGRMIAAVAAAAGWLSGAWLAALARRERRGGLLAMIGAAAVVLAVVLGALHEAGSVAARPDGWGPVAASVLPGVLSCVLAITAAAVITRTEPGALTGTRRRWRRARAAHGAAVSTQLADAEAAAVAAAGWLGLVRAQAAADAGEAGAGSEQLTRDAALVASAMI